MGRSGKLLVIRHIRASFQGYVTSTFCYQTKTGRGESAFDINVFRSLSNSTCLSYLDLLATRNSLLLSRPIHPISPMSYSSKPFRPDFSHLPGARLPKSDPIRDSKFVLEISPKQAQDAFQYCLESVRNHDMDSYLLMLTLPKRVQPEVLAISALNVELALVRDKLDSRKSKDTMGIYRLQFWKDALAAIYGKSSMPVPRQPIAIALCSFAPSASFHLLQSLITARQQSIGDRPFRTIDELSSYGISTTGSLIRLHADALARHFGVYCGEEVIVAAEKVGAAYGLMNLVRASLPLLSRGIVLLPSDLLSLYDLSPEKIYSKKNHDASKAVVKDIVQVAAAYLQSGRNLCYSIPNTIRPAFVATACGVDHIIKITKKVDYNIYSTYLQRRNPLFLWSVLWKRLLRTY